MDVGQGGIQGPFCPDSSYFFFACVADTMFLGCCTDVNACVNSCSHGTLGPMAVDPNWLGEIPDQVCNPGSVWLTGEEATGFEKTFAGCCQDVDSTGPNAACVLWPAFLDVENSSLFVQFNSSANDDSNIAYPAPYPSAELSSSHSAPNAKTSTSSSTVHSVMVLYPEYQGPGMGSASDSGYQLNRDSIIGIAVGGTVALVLVVALVATVLRKKLARRHSRMNPKHVLAVDGGNETGEVGKTPEGAPQTRTVVDVEEALKCIAEGVMPDDDSRKTAFEGEYH